MRRTSTYLILFVSIASFLILTLGFSSAIKDIVLPSNSKPVIQQPISKPATNGGLLLSMGDSLTRGVGDPEGRGYIGIVKEKLQESSSQPITLVNLAVQGQTSSQLLAQLHQPQVQEMIKQAKWIIFTIGGNDLNHQVDDLSKVNQKAVDQAREQYAQNLREIFRIMRKQNSHSPIYMLGLYNPYIDRENNKETSEIISEWNKQMELVASEFSHVVVVPVFDLFQLDPNSYLYTDHFHPNQKGYERMATRVLQVIPK